MKKYLILLLVFTSCINHSIKPIPLVTPNSGVQIDMSKDYLVYLEVPSNLDAFYMVYYNHFISTDVLTLHHQNNKVTGTHGSILYLSDFDPSMKNYLDSIK